MSSTFVQSPLICCISELLNMSVTRPNSESLLLMQLNTTKRCFVEPKLVLSR
jgi:hypothetical protein